MMRRSCVFFAAFAAAMLVAAGAPAATVTVNEGEDLAAAITNAAAGDTIKLKNTSGSEAVWPLTAPVVITKDLEILGDPDFLPTESVIEGGGAVGGCTDNAVDNGDFEAGQTSPWLSNPPTPPVIVQDPARAASGEWLAQFTLDPCATPTPDLAPDQVELRYIPPTPVPNIPPAGPERVEWATLPVPPEVNAAATLTIWIKAHVPVPGGNQVIVTLRDSFGVTGTATINEALLTAAADWTPVPLPVVSFMPPLTPLATVTSLTIESQFPPLSPDDPACVLIGGAEFALGALALPGADRLNVGFALFTGNGLGLVDLTTPFAGTPQALRLGGLVAPALRFSVRAETPQPGDKLELLPRLGEAALWSAASEALTGPNCQTFSVPVTPPDSVYPVFRATIQPPVAVAGPVTRFIIDDFSLSTLGAWLFAQVKTGNLFPHGDMEDAGLTAADWSAATPCAIFGPPLPASYFTGPGCGPSAHALLLTRQTGAATVVTLTQNVTFPSAGEEIRFKLRVGQPGGPENTFKVDVGGDVVLDTDAADASLGAWKEIIYPYPPAWRNTSRVLRFSAQLADGPAPASFLIDDVCIGQPPAGPVLSVSNAHLRLENLTVSTGSDGVSADDDTGKLTFVRCATKNISGAGLRFSGKATGTASNSVFTGCSGPAVLSDSTGIVTVYQCTAKGNGGGIRANSGSINLAASIIEDGNVTGVVNTWLNVIRGGFPAAYEQAGYENLDPATTTVNYTDSPWIGKLEALQPVPSGHNIVANDPVTGLVGSGDGLFDFEGEVRSALVGEEVQVGADQEGGVVGTPMWMACTVSPAIVGPGEPVTITVVTQGIDLGIASLRIMPEEPQPGATPDPTLPQMCYEIPLEGSNTVTISFSGPRDKISVVPPGVLLYAEGVNRIYLNDGTDPANPVLYGGGMPATAPGAGDCTFLVDTTPPTLLFTTSDTNTGNAATVQPSVTANDSLVGTGIPGPQGDYAIPVSGGTIVDRALHFLFNPGGNGTCADTAAGEMLTFGIEAVFEDRPPADLTNITTSGFESDTGTDFTAKGDGRAWLEGPLGPTDSGTTTVTLSTDPAATVKRLTARFEAVTSQSVPDPWHFEGKPAARDLAGNEITAPNPLVLWWMWRAQAEITNGPRDTQTLSPRFDWKLRRNIKGPDAADVAPIVPYVKAKLWRGADPAADREISTMSWVPVTPAWSGWISGPITPETDMGGSPLSVLLQANQNDPDVSHTLMLTVVGADEAGNVQPAGLADNASVTVTDLGNSCVSYTWWYNGQSQENVSVDTEARVALSEWRRNTATNADVETRPYGSVTRVPLPPKEAPPLYDYLKLRAVLTARLPETIRRAVFNGESNVAQAWIKWTLYEDGNPVANNNAVVGPGADFVDIILPVSPATATGLVFGDMKNRKREKRYVLTAQTVLTTYSYSTDGTAFPPRVISDPTPASVSFTVYPKEVDDNLRDERPTRIYERE